MSSVITLNFRFTQSHNLLLKHCQCPSVDNYILCCGQEANDTKRSHQRFEIRFFGFGQPLIDVDGRIE